jgi:hypothetical protein
MKTEDGSKNTIVALRDVVRALERRFPEHNGPFDYGTRLAEEMGELIEIMYEVRGGIKSAERAEHLVKEMQDVMRIAYGIAGLYGLADVLPQNLEAFIAEGDPKDAVAYITLVGVRGGALASAVNHAEGMGVKKEKHGDGAHQRVLEAARALAQAIVWVMIYFDVTAEFETRAAKSWAECQEMGFID